MGRWNPDHPARVGLLPRQGAGADVIWCEVEPAYVFHVANAYELPHRGAARLPRRPDRVRLKAEV